jgi:ribosomal protein S18 acetylase RimI-like enzyme
MNTNALALYMGTGFTKLGKHARYYRVSDDCFADSVILELAISEPK